MSNLTRRLLLRGLPMAPAMAKQAAGEIAKEIAGKAVATMDAGYSLSARSVPGGIAGSDDPWDLAHKWTMSQVKAGIIPDHKVIEYRRQARFLARAGLDPDVEALGSVSSSYRRRMHEESAYRATIRQEIEGHESTGLFRSILDKFGRRS